MNRAEYEIIQHDNNYRIFVVNLLYRTPHVHKDFEIDLVLSGNLQIICPTETYSLAAGDIFIVNPFQSHEIRAAFPCQILSLQISNAIYSNFFQKIDNIEFTNCKVNSGEFSDELKNQLISLAKIYYEVPDFSNLRANILIGQILLNLLTNQPYNYLDPKVVTQVRVKTSRMRKIIHYIDEHYQEKLLLSDIAEIEGLDMYYLSHFFSDTFGIPFQSYLKKIRCEKARQLLLLTDFSLLDICINCGFSDPKYFNKGFTEQYGCTPKQYRKDFAHAKLRQQQKSLLTTQEFLSDRSAIVTLDNYLTRNSSR